MHWTGLVRQLAYFWRIISVVGHQCITITEKLKIHTFQAGKKVLLLRAKNLKHQVMMALVLSWKEIKVITEIYFLGSFSKMPANWLKWQWQMLNLSSRSSSKTQCGTNKTPVFSTLIHLAFLLYRFQIVFSSVLTRVFLCSGCFFLSYSFSVWPHKLNFRMRKAMRMFLILFKKY